MALKKKDKEKKENEAKTKEKQKKLKEMRLFFQSYRPLHFALSRLISSRLSNCFLSCW